MAKMMISNFDIDQIMRSGQCFGINQLNDNTYSIIHRDKYLEIEVKEDGTYSFKCSDEDMGNVWAYYFDLRSPTYSEALNKVNISDDEYLKAAVDYGSGIRILNQDLWEMMVSFIISQNNNIPRIKKIIGTLRNELGEKHVAAGKEFYSFPKAAALMDEEKLKELGLGYRAPFVANLAAGVENGSIDLKYLQALRDYESAHNYLMSIYGIGPKVAACIELFGLHRMNAFPIDTWMAKVIDREYGGKFPIQKYRGYEGIIQQYMFFYEINHKEGGK